MGKKALLVQGEAGTDTSRWFGGLTFASRVFPVPGGPISRQPLGMRAPTAVKRSGRFRNSTICNEAERGRKVKNMN